MSLVAQVARSVSGVVELEDLLGLCAEIIGDRVTCRTCTVALYEPQETSIGLMVRAQPEAEDPPALCWLRTPIRQGFMVRAAQSGKSVHLDDVARSGLAHEQEREIWHEGRALAVPIPYESSAVAVAVLHRMTDDGDFSAHDIKSVGELAKVMGPAIRTAKLHHRQRCQTYGVMESLADALENRDPQRRGHSARVFAYAMPIATAMELTQAQIGATQIAARLHDIGRIIVPDDVANHAGPLTDQQWEIVRRHPEAGSNLLKPLDFFGEVCQIIRAHHESYDGTGYPDNKAGEEIPVVARVIAVADAFDAMTSPRPYREAMSVDDALEQIRKLAGQQFDPQAADALANIAPAVLRDIQGSWR
jgi:HD-GYP domain-containing protein (c-di-GMP phosphodiesterase class II)